MCLRESELAKLFRLMKNFLPRTRGMGNIQLPVYPPLISNDKSNL